MEHKASIHIEEGKPSNPYHNSREHSTVNSIFPTDKNEITLSGEAAIQLYSVELKKRIGAYTERTKQKIQKNAFTHLSVIVNLNVHHSLLDLNPLKEYLERTLDTFIFQICTHKDEGHVDREGIKIVNSHAHLEMLGLDSNGYSIRKKLTRDYLSMLQTMNAKFLGMQRGEKNSKRKRLSTYDFKEAMKISDQKHKLSLDAQKTLGNENKDLNNDLKKSQTSEKFFREQSLKSDKTIAKHKEDVKIFAAFIKNTSDLFNFSATSLDDLDELFDIIKNSQNTPDIVSILPDTIYDLGGANNKI